ncbi:hypothetical protein JCGZ_16255 [Jatropha curcas]|uniref:Uncharacterized protein n=1 Tax=Jatropha curcas TaxID=180498 RepID=A0A067L7M9_JATCU|nr:hypothetical protein JCGZ_16255 [Jatropha curcas]
MRSLSLAVVVILILMSRSSCLGAVSTPQEMISNNSFSFSMADTNMELELMMDSETNRMLTASTNSATGGVGNPNRPALDCRPGNRYCLPVSNPGTRKACPRYKRDCLR